MEKRFSLTERSRRATSASSILVFHHGTKSSRPASTCETISVGFAPVVLTPFSFAGLGWPRAFPPGPGHGTLPAPMHRELGQRNDELSATGEEAFVTFL